MSLYKNIILAAGTLTLAYLMLKVLQNKVEPIIDKASDFQKRDDDDDEVEEEKNNENDSLETTQTNSKTSKRKIVGTEKAMKLPRPRPNFFLGFQVYNTEIHRKVKELQEKIISKTPSLHPALVNVSTLHVTLGVTHLESKTDIKTLKEKLDAWSNDNLKSFFDKPVVLNFTGVKTFNDVVAYVDMVKCKNYQKLSNLSLSLNNLVSSAGFSTDSRAFTPHLTILKLSKNLKLVKMKKRFKSDFETLKECKENFGEQEVSHIQLLSMDDPKDENGYYKCYHQINVSDVKLDMDHSLCCSPIPKPKKIY